MKLIDLFEESNSNVLSYDDLTIDDFIERLTTECKDSLRLLKQDDFVLWKGIKDHVRSPFSQVDPARTPRKSKDTSNYYTMILDNVPEMQEYPKRSRSLIASTSEQTAHHFGSAYAVFPVDGSKIGVVNESDIWNVNVDFWGIWGGLPIWNSIFKALNLDVNNWNTFKKQLSEKAPDNLIQYMDSFDIDDLPDVNTYDEHVLTGITEDRTMLEILKEYTPKKLGFTLKTTSNFVSNISDSEVWIGGNCLLVHSSKLQDVKDKLR